VSPPRVGIVQATRKRAPKAAHLIASRQKHRRKTFYTAFLYPYMPPHTSHEGSVVDLMRDCDFGIAGAFSRRKFEMSVTFDGTLDAISKERKD